jgi:restriction system protein
MSRSRGFVSAMIRMERAARRAQAAQARALARAQRADERFRLAEAKEQKRNYIESRLAEVEDQNSELLHTVVALESILSHGLAADFHLDLELLKEPLTDDPFKPGHLAYPMPVP